MEETSRHSDQEQDLIYALDIGTRSVIGLLARQEQDKMRVLEVESGRMRDVPCWMDRSKISGRWQR